MNKRRMEKEFKHYYKGRHGLSFFWKLIILIIIVIFILYAAGKLDDFFSWLLNLI